MAVRVECCPEEALIDQIISIQVLNLVPFSSVTVSAWVEQNGKHFGSYGHYTASDNGQVDLSKDSAEPSGMYDGVECMGLFWSMVSVPGQRMGERLYQGEASKPLLFEIRVYDGHLSWDELFVEKCEEQNGLKAGCSEENLLAKKIVLRSYKAPDVSRIVVETGRIRGTLFIPAGLQNGEKRPGVIDMFGSRGGLLEMRAALLASHGFVAMALAYFQYKDLPNELCFEYEYFEEAAHWLQSQPNVAPGGIGMVGVSLGAQIAFYMGLNCPVVKSAIGIGFPPTFGLGIKFTMAGQRIPCQSIEHAIMEKHETGMSLIMNYDLEKYFSFNTSHTPSLLFIIGSEDTTLKVSDVTKWLDTLSDTNQSMVEVTVYQGAGHLIEPPHAPLCSSVYNKWFKNLMSYGGTTKLHAVAQEESWKQIRDFLWSTLGKEHTKSRL